VSGRYPGDPDFGGRIPRNGCCACYSDFTSVKLFDQHRVGKHAYSYAEGLDMTPSREDGRRCLDKYEMLALGWEQDENERWFDPVSVEAARKGFAELHGRPRSAREQDSDQAAG